MTLHANRSTPASRPVARKPIDAYRTLYRSQPVERIEIVRAGIQAADAKMWLDMPDIGSMALLKALDLSVATFNRKVKTRETLSKAESERVVGFARLVGQVEAMVENVQDGDDFDARSWIARWLTEPLPALGQARPIDFMDTMEGQRLVSQKLAQVAGGAYA